MSKISEVINKNYRDYSMYVLGHRAIPSAIDGFKTSQRKILYTAIKTAKTKLKTASLAGNAISHANYHHGPASLESAIGLMTAEWANNVSLLEGEGNFGSRLVNEPAAARYTMVKLANAYQKYFADDDLLSKYPSPDPEDPEPRHYLPLIPWVLVNGIKGIAIGYACEIQPRDPKVLKRLCSDYLAGKNIDNRKCLPYYSSFKGEIKETDEGYFCIGTWEVQARTKIRITELPYGIEREKYIKHLDKLEDAGEIVGYLDNCSKNSFDFLVTLKRNHKFTTDNKIISKFGLQKKLNENLTLLGHDGKLKIFDNPIQIIKYFCDWRLEQYKVRYAHYIRRDEDKYEELRAIRKFIDAVNNGEIIMKNKNSIQIRAQIQIAGIDVKFNPRCMAMPISAFGEENSAKIDEDIKKIKEDLDTWRSINIKNEMINEIKSL